MEPLSKKTILIIDDEELITSALARKLIDAGFNVLTQRNGEDGLKVALSERPDMILLDLIMPKMDGMTFLEELRADSDWGRSVPIIVLTNLESGEEVERSKKLRVYDYLVKTNWSLSDVLEKVKKAING